VELMPGAKIDAHSCFGISRWINNINSRNLGSNYSYLIRLTDGYKYPNSGGASYCQNFPSSDNSQRKFGGLLDMRSGSFKIFVNGID